MIFNTPGKKKHLHDKVCERNGEMQRTSVTDVFCEETGCVGCAENKPGSVT